MIIQDTFRSLISFPKNIYKNQNITFDLSYITPHIIVSSGPTNDPLKKWYRYPIEDLVQLLTSNHGQNWKIWNLRGEGKGYKSSDVNNKYEWFPFPDHQPPSFQLLIDCIESIHHFLHQTNDNVALIHCKAGKGRSGTICCAYLMLENMLATEEANNMYSIKRMRFGGKGVSIVSQLRYLDYWYNYLQNHRLYVVESPIVEMTIRIVNVMYDDTKVELKVYKQIENRNGIEIIDIDSDFYWQNDDLVSDIILNGLDFNLVINSYTCCWFNIYFETIKSSYNNDYIRGYEEIQKVVTGNDEDSSPRTDHNLKGHFLIHWDQMDGFKGTRILGIKRFDRIIVNWKYK